MLETIKAIILDHQETMLQTGVRRQLVMMPVPNKAAVCIGVRRSGKSTCLFQIMQSLLDSGVSRQNILYLNFFDDRLHPLQHGGIGMVADAYYSLYPGKKQQETVYIFLDEIQMVADWEPFADRLLRTEKCELYLTGSSARMLSKELATQMRGRALTWELFPFSFKEFLEADGIKNDTPFSTKERLLVQNRFEAYWEAGGFPEVISLDRRLRLKIHQEYFHTILYRDLVERNNISHPQAVLDLAYWLMDNIASLYTINSLTGYLKSRGHKAPKSAVTEYLEWFEDAYFLFTVRLFDASLSRSNVNPKKIYCVDHGLVRSVSSGILANTGHLLENLVFTALRRVSSAIFYYRTRSGKEVDFIVLMPARGRSAEPGQARLLVQVCETMADLATRKRELAALHEAMTELESTHATVVTRHDDEIIENDNRRITVVPAWKWLLEIDAALSS
ncbi:MAG: ATP-binding protein [Geobacteraceae bacterium]|nr:ATP-binding protein [Geobacteraceae bacterium]